MKKKISLLLVVLMLVTFMPMSMAESREKAVVSTQKFTVNGKAEYVDAYIIKGKNYLKLRDVAYALKGTKAQFDVGYDEQKNLIMLETNKPYGDSAGNITRTSDNSYMASMQDMNLLVDGKEKKIRSAAIFGYNYIELRNLAELIGFDIDYDASTRTVVIKSEKLKMPCKLKFDLEDFDGNKFNIADILSEHDYTFVNVWGTFCGPCRNEMPELAKLGEDYKDKVGFIGIVRDVKPLTDSSSSTDKNIRDLTISDAKNILSKANAKFKNYVSTQEAKAFLDTLITGIPTSFIIDSEGNVVDTLIGASASGNYERYKRAIDKYIQ